MSTSKGLAVRKAQEAVRSVPDVSPFKRIEAWLGSVKDVEEYNGYDAALCKLLNLESASFEQTKENPLDGKSLFTMTIPGDLCNMTGALHGGAVALIFDICTSIVLMLCSRDGFWDTGHVSRALNCTYLRPVMAGETIWIESETVHVGKRLSSLRGVIKNKDGKVCYTCEHQKAAVGSSAL